MRVREISHFRRDLRTGGRYKATGIMLSGRQY